MIDLMKQDAMHLMVISSGKESTEAAEIKRYAGVGVVKVLAVNPTAAEIEKYMGYTPQSEPVYTGNQDVDGSPVPSVRISFVVQTVPELSGGVELTHMMTYFLRDQQVVGSQSGKVQVIDEYGRTAWTDRETAEKHEQIVYENGPARISTDYHILRVGEADIINFLRTYLNLDSPENYHRSTNTWTLKAPEELKTLKSAFDDDDFKKIFSGDVSPIKAAIANQPNNKIKVVFGVNNTDKGQFQDIYTRVVLRSSARSVDAIEKSITEAKSRGGLQNREYDYAHLHEYVVEPTDFKAAAPEDDDLPFSQM